MLATHSANTGIIIATTIETKIIGQAKKFQTTNNKVTGTASAKAVNTKSKYTLIIFAKKIWNGVTGKDKSVMFETSIKFLFSFTIPTIESNTKRINKNIVNNS